MRWSAGEHLERVDGPGKSATIFDRDAKEITLLTPASRTYRKLEGAPRRPMEPEKGAVLKRGAESVMAELHCIDWSWTEDVETHTVCATPDGVMLRLVVDGKTVVEARSVSYGPQRAELFGCRRAMRPPWRRRAARGRNAGGHRVRPGGCCRDVTSGGGGGLTRDRILTKPRRRLILVISFGIHRGRRGVAVKTENESRTYRRPFRARGHSAGSMIARGWRCSVAGLTLALAPVAAHAQNAQPPLSLPVKAPPPDGYLSPGPVTPFTPWLDMVSATQAAQPSWMTPLVTVTPRLEQEFRWDFYDQQNASPNTSSQGNGQHLLNYGGPGGPRVEFIPAYNWEVILAPPPYETASGPKGSAERLGRLAGVPCQIPLHFRERRTAIIS